MGTSSFTAMHQWRHEHQAAGMARLTSVTIFPVFSRLSLYLVFLKSFQSQVSWGLGTISADLFGNACSSKRVRMCLGSLHGRAAASLTVLFSHTFISPCLGSRRGFWRLFLPFAWIVTAVVTSAIPGHSCFCQGCLSWQ